MPFIGGAKKKKKEGGIHNVPSKLKPWVRFLKKYGGKGYTREQLRDMYANLKIGRAYGKKTLEKVPEPKGKKRKGKKKSTTKYNPWIAFLKKHGGKGLSKEELLAKYKKEKK
jgi:hypothetical protein